MPTKVKPMVKRLRRQAVRASMTLGPSRRSGPRVLVTSLPKSGTHLLSAVLEQFPELKKFPGNRIDPPPPWTWLPGGSETITVGIGHPRTVDRIRLRRFLSNLHPGTVVTGHVPYSPELAADLGQLGFRVIAMVRDPRDVVVSKVRFANSTPDGRRDRGIPKGESPERQISLSIEGYSFDGEPVAGVDIGSRLASIAAWQPAGALVVRFEDLVGDKGGGSADVQSATIRAIRAHLDLSSDDDVVARAASRSYGSSPTFRQGRSNAWTEHLSADQAARIVTLAGTSMVQLGYTVGPSTAPSHPDLTEA